MIKWNDEMIEDLKVMKIKEFAEKYNMSENSARTKLKKINEETKNVVEEKKEDEVEKEEKEVINSSELKIIPSVILDINKLISQGVTFYTQESKNEINKYEKMILDLEHTLENNYNLSNEDKINISENIGIIRRKRRLHKNEVELIEKNKLDCQAFVKFIQIVKDFSSEIDNRVYKTRILKEEIGINLIASENNTMIKELKEKANMNEEVIQRLLDLEKSNLKFRRKEAREKGQVVAIDKIKPNWKDLMNTLDTQTKQGIIDDAYKMYKGVDITEVKDFVVWNSIMPELLLEKGYFLR